MLTRPSITKFLVRAALISTLFLAACSTNSNTTNNTPATTTTTSAMVADFGNNRVLIYGVPLGTAFDQAASTVLGQAGFTTAGTGTTASTMNQPTAVAVDAKGNIYVAESGNCRVTQFVSPITSGMSASVVFGQANLTTGTCPTSSSATSATSLYDPYGATVDHAGDLWVDDYLSSRIVEYVPPFTNGMAAALAIGQPNLTSGSSTQTTTSATLNLPGFPIFDPSGNLWIADYTDNRVLEYKPPFSTGMAASVVLGQGSFTTKSPGTAATTMDGPWAVAFDGSGNLWMADFGNNRVLEFVPPFTNGMAASLVLGQANFVNSMANDGFGTPTAATLSSPLQVAFSSSGNLWVNDSGNNRTLVFAPPFTNGMNATDVIGQPSSSADSPNQAAGPTSATQSSPAGVVTGPPLY